MASKQVKSYEEGYKDGWDDARGVNKRRQRGWLASARLLGAAVLASGLVFLLMYYLNSH